MPKTLLLLLATAAALLSLTKCSKNKSRPKPSVISKAIDTINLNGRWTGSVYTGDNTTLGSFEIVMSESANPSNDKKTIITGAITTPPLCKEMENQGHTSIPVSDIGGTRDFDKHIIFIPVFYTTKRFQNGNVVPGEIIGWEFDIDSLWVNSQGVQLTEKPVIEGPARVTANCNTQGYRVRLRKS